MEPLEYCKHWVSIPPEDRGYRKACIPVLAKATGLSELTIKGWGSDFEQRPEYVLHLLELAHQLNQVRQITGHPDYPKK